MTLPEAERIARGIAALAAKAGATPDAVHRAYYAAIAQALITPTKEAA